MSDYNVLENEAVFSSAPSRAVLYDAEAEQAVLGSVFIAGLPAFEEVQWLSSDMFYLIKNRWVWDAMGRLVASGNPIDVLLVSRELEKRAQLDEVGGVAYLTRLINAVPTSLYIERYAQIVKGNHQRRMVLEVATKMAKVAYDEKNELGDALNGIVSEITDLIDAPMSDIQPIAEAMRELYQRVEAVAESPDAFRGLQTGIMAFDTLTGGLFNGEMTVITGEPGTGKSILGIQAGTELAKLGAGGAIFEMEMGRLQISARQVSANIPTGNSVSTRAMRFGPLNDPDLPLIAQAISELSQLPIWVSTSTKWTTTMLRAALTKLKREQNIEWFVLDFFDLLKDKVEPSWERDNRMAYALHDICKDLSLIGLVIHTLNKSGLTGGGKRTLSQVGGGSKIVYAADNVIYIDHHQPEGGQAAMPNVRTLSSGKQREGAGGVPTHIVYLPGRPAFGDLALPVQGQTSGLPKLYDASQFVE